MRARCGVWAHLGEDQRGHHSCQVAGQVEGAGASGQLPGVAPPRVQQDLRQPPAKGDDEDRPRLQGCGAHRAQLQLPNACASYPERRPHLQGTPQFLPQSETRTCQCLAVNPAREQGPAACGDCYTCCERPEAQLPSVCALQRKQLLTINWRGCSMLSLCVYYDVDPTCTC